MPADGKSVVESYKLKEVSGSHFTALSAETLMLSLGLLQPILISKFQQNGGSGWGCGLEVEHLPSMLEVLSLRGWVHPQDR
jgi:hypothetical protein